MARFISMRQIPNQVALVSQEESFVNLISRALSSDSTVVDHLAISTDGARSILLQRPDMIVMDRRSLSAPFLEMRRIRRRRPLLAIFVANAAHDAECAAFLQEGADDACTADSLYLRTRLQAMLRRVHMANAQTRIAFEDILLDREYRRVWCRTKEVFPSHIEYDVLLLLFNHAPRIVSKEALESLLVRQSHRASDSNTLQVHISALRKKLAESERVGIATIRGVGYALGAFSKSTKTNTQCGMYTPEIIPIRQAR